VGVLAGAEARREIVAPRGDSGRQQRRNKIRTRYEPLARVNYIADAMTREAGCSPSVIFAALVLSKGVLFCRRGATHLAADLWEDEAPSFSLPACPWVLSGLLNIGIFAGREDARSAWRGLAKPAAKRQQPKAESSRLIADRLRRSRAAPLG
jgi:hypothetical protein